MLLFFSFPVIKAEGVQVTHLKPSSTLTEFSFDRGQETMLLTFKAHQQDKVSAVFLLLPSRQSEFFFPSFPFSFVYKFRYAGFLRCPEQATSAAVRVISRQVMNKHEV